MYIYKQPGWPNFYWDSTQIMRSLSEIEYARGRLNGVLQAFGGLESLQLKVEMLSQDVLATSEIEGEILQVDSVRSSIARRCGIALTEDGTRTVDARAEGIIQISLDTMQQAHLPLSKERLLSWHKLLFAERALHEAKIQIGAYREGPVFVVSGQMGDETIHYEGPPAEHLEAEMQMFFARCNRPCDTPADAILRAAVAQLWFVLIHPFDDGNGRIGRAISDLFMARAEWGAMRHYSVSAQILKARKSYYEILQRTKRGGLDITAWMLWYLGVFKKALLQSHASVSESLARSRFWKEHGHINFNERQRKMLSLLLDHFYGALTTEKWAKITGCSHDTALRDIKDLVEKGILRAGEAAGRSQRYELLA